MAALLVVTACTGRPTTTGRHLSDLRRECEHTLATEGMLATLSDVTYDSVIDNWRELRAEYTDILAVEATNEEAKTRIATIEKRIALLAAERDYASKIEIKGLRRGSGTLRHFGLPTEGIFGEVKNTGDFTVVTLKLRFELLDVNGKRVTPEQEWTPVSQDSGGQPMRPNYTVPFGFAVQDAASDWEKLKGRVMLVRLSREGATFPEEKEN